MQQIKQIAEQGRQLWLNQSKTVRLAVLFCLMAVPAWGVVETMFPDQPRNRIQLQKTKERLSPTFVSTAGAEKLEGQNTAAALDATRNYIQRKQGELDSRAIEQAQERKRMQEAIDAGRMERAQLVEQLQQQSKQMEILSQYVTNNSMAAQNQPVSLPASAQGTAPSRQQATVSTNPNGSQLRIPMPTAQVATRPAQPSRSYQPVLSRGGAIVAGSNLGTTSQESAIKEQKRKEHAKQSISQNTQRQSKSKEEQIPETWLAAGTIISGTMLTGHHVPTSGSAKKDPAPVMMKITHEALMPNQYTIDLRGCVIIGAARGSLSTRRVEIRAESISCIDELGRAIEQPLMAIALGPDGNGGLPAKLVTLHGEAVKKSAMSGIFGTAAETLKGATVNGASTISVSDTSQLSSMMGGALAGGASTAFDKIADFYLELAEESKPYLEMQPGIEGVDFVVQRGIGLKIRG